MNNPAISIGMIGVRGISTDQIGGIEAVVTELSKALVDANFRCYVYIRSVVSANFQKKSENLKIIKTRRLPTMHLDTFSYSFFASIHASYSCNIVHYHGVGPALMCWLPRLLGKKVIVTVHGADWRREKWNKFAKLSLVCGAWVARFFAHEITAVSQPCADESSSLIGRNVICIPNGLIDRACQATDEFESKYGLARQEYYLFLGRLVPEKRVDLLIKAFRRLRTDKKLVIAGDAPYGSSLQEQLKRLASSDPRVMFVGSVTGGCKAGLLGNAYCLILPSMIEGHAMVILEAVDASVPVLCSNIPENLFAIGDSRMEGRTEASGLLFQAGDQDALVSAMEIAEAQPNMLEIMARHAKQHLTEKFNWQNIVTQYQMLYVKTLST